MNAIFDYRNARTALQLFNEGGEALATLGQHPALGALLDEMTRAQEGE